MADREAAMPYPYPVLDPETGSLVMVDHYTLEEVAAMFGLSLSTARRRVHDGEWTVWEPIQGSYLMTAEHIAEARERATHRAVPPTPTCPEAGPPRLGVPVAPADLEGLD
jgi:hypothetical protein